MLRSVVFYTDHGLDPKLYALCRDQLQRAALGLNLITVALERPSGFGTQVVLPDERGVLTMHRQILAGLRLAPPGAVWLCEHDVLYHPSHFHFVPERPDTFYYNVNVWHVSYYDGHAVYYDAHQVSGLCAERDLLMDYYDRRIGQLQAEGFNRHYEPGLRQTVGGQRVADWRSAYANLDIRHGRNLTTSKWSLDDFRDKRYAAGWQEADELPGWGRLADLFQVGVGG